MIRIGITGGIGSGKSVVASLLKLSGIPVYIADEESKRLTNSSTVIRDRLTKLFGKELYDAEGLNKKRLAELIFQDKEILQQVNGIIHPEVNRHFTEWVQHQQGGICAIESAILFESGFNKFVDLSLMVYAPKELRIERALARDAASRAEIERRIVSQLSDEIKKERADYVIYNDGKQALIPQVQQLLQTLQQGLQIGQQKDA